MREAGSPARRCKSTVTVVCCATGEETRHDLNMLHHASHSRRVSTHALSPVGPPMDPALIIALVWLALPIILLILWLRARSAAKRTRGDLEAKGAEMAALESKHSSLESKYEPIISIEAEVLRLQADASRIRGETDALRSAYAEKRQILNKLEAQVAIYDEKLAFAELGVYRISTSRTVRPTRRRSQKFERSRRRWLQRNQPRFARLDGQSMAASRRVRL